jgi:hypothetical protein
MKAFKESPLSIKIVVVICVLCCLSFPLSIAFIGVIGMNISIVLSLTSLSVLIGLTDEHEAKIKTK